VALLGLALCPMGATAAETAGPNPEKCAIVDVTLHSVPKGKTDILLGRVLDEKGQPLGKQSVQLVRGEKLLASAWTDPQGYFAFCNVPGGVYRLRMGQLETACRAWRSEAAPPGAQPGVVLIAGATTVRGQMMPGPGGRILSSLRNPWVAGAVGAAIATAIAVPIAIAADDDDEEAPATP
jgi:hypothetical protein